LAGERIALAVDKCVSFTGPRAEDIKSGIFALHLINHSGSASGHSRQKDGRHASGHLSRYPRRSQLYIHRWSASRHAMGSFARQ